MILSSAKIQKKKNLNHQIETQKLPRMEGFPLFLGKQDKYTMGPGQLDLSQQICQSINTFLNKYLSKIFFDKKN